MSSGTVMIRRKAGYMAQWFISEIKCLGPKRMCKRAGNAGTSFKRCFLLVFLIFNGNLH